MPHQCLKCGKTYPDGSPEVLKGCSCGGTRFFYTKERLSDEEREKLQIKADMELRAIVEQLARAKEKPDYQDVLWSEQSRKAWIKLTPGDIRAVISSIQAKPELIPEPTPAEVLEKEIKEELKEIQKEVKPMMPPAPKPAKAIEEPKIKEVKLIEKGEVETKPETVEIMEPGVYSVDVKGLLEHSPVIVQKDGSYLIHLPSVFESTAKPRKKARLKPTKS